MKNARDLVFRLVIWLSARSARVGRWYEKLLGRADKHEIGELGTGTTYIEQVELSDRGVKPLNVFECWLLSDFIAAQRQEKRKQVAAFEMPSRVARVEQRVRELLARPVEEILAGPAEKPRDSGEWIGGEAFVRDEVTVQRLRGYPAT